jgi:ribulose-phosphate 3-epimerase
VEIEVDGGITAETAELAARAGANVFVAGSSAFRGGAEAYRTNVDALRAAAGKGLAAH